MLQGSKDWNQHVRQTEDLARTLGFRRLRDRIVALAEPQPDDVVVDVGAGTGLLSLALAPRVRRVWGIDISPAMMEYLRVKAASAPASSRSRCSCSTMRGASCAPGARLEQRGSRLRKQRWPRTAGG
jgi:2-polyprenyl-3-methyl-5-hydroxy-6-metoxy-1,4-benzoquinol methylase